MTSTYENVPLTDTPHALTAEEAAKRTGRTLASFRTVMSKLNHGGRDLRTPINPNERARKYDLDKLDAWIKDGKPIPEATNIPKPKPDARTINATATRTGTTWTLTLEELEQETQTENLRDAQRIAHALAAQKTGLAPDEFTINLTTKLPTKTAQQWEEVKTKQAEAKAATVLAAKLSRQVVLELQALGCTYSDIGDLLGISFQRAQQLGSTVTAGKQS